MLCCRLVAIANVSVVVVALAASVCRAGNPRLLRIELNADITEPHTGTVFSAVVPDLLTDQLASGARDDETRCVGRVHVGYDIGYTKNADDSIHVTGTITLFEGRGCRDTERRRLQVDETVPPDQVRRVEFDLQERDNRATGALVLDNGRPTCTGRHVRFRAHMSVFDDDSTQRQEFDSPQISMFLEPGQVTGIEMRRTVAGEVTGSLTALMRRIERDAVTVELTQTLIEGGFWDFDPDTDDDVQRRTIIIPSRESRDEFIRGEDDGNVVETTSSMSNGGQQCWVEVTGTVAVVPASPPPCGNGRVDRGEQCDQGLANGSATSCCTRRCTFRPRGEVCRASASVCDVADTCPGSSTDCPDAQAPDVTTCDDGNACNGVANCQSGQCVPGPLADCRAGDTNVCSYNPCDSQLGCQVPPVGIPGCDPGRTAEAFVGGPTNECSGGTREADGGCVLRAGNAVVRIPPNALAVATPITVAAMDIGACPLTCGSGYWSLRNAAGRIASCVQLLPQGVTFDVPVSLSLGWTTATNACNARFQCPRGGTFEEGGMLVYRGDTQVADQCGAAARCPTSSQMRPCLAPDLCCATPGTCGKATMCDPATNTWTLRSVRQF
jgi:hypothetical protein